MTVTNHTALYRFTFPEPIRPANGTYPNHTTQALPLSPVILVDLTDLPDSRTNATVEVDPDTGRIMGNGTFAPSFGFGSYDSYFCIDFDLSETSIRDTGVWMNNRPGPEPKYLNTFLDSNSPPLPAGAWTHFNAPKSNEIIVRVGISFISTAKACQNAQDEVPDFGFQETLLAAQNAWNEKLSVITIDPEGVDTDIQTIFWSGVYRSMLSPQDYTGENPLWESDEPYYDSYYCIWDSFRSVHPFITLVDPTSQTRMIRSLIDIYRFEGKSMIFS